MSNESIKELVLTGVITSMHQRPKGSSSVKEPHTVFEIAVGSMNEKTFTQLVKDIGLSSHFVSLGIKIK